MAKRKPHKTPPVGSRFEKRYRGKTYALKVIEKDGKVLFEVSGKHFDTPTGAAKQITKHEINGWKFWKLG